MLFKPPKPVGMHLNLAPMVDVMMCLIIFFLLASKLVNAAHKPLELPYAVAAKEVERSELGARVVINVRPKGGGAVGEADFVVNGWDGREITERLLQPTEIEGYLAAAAKQAAGTKETLSCVIRADREVTYKNVETVLVACGKAKITNIVFSAKAGAEPERAP